MDYFRIEDTENKLVSHLESLDASGVGLVDQENEVYYFNYIDPHSIIPQEELPIYFQTKEGGSNTISINGRNYGSSAVSFEYSFDNQNWNTWSSSVTQTSSNWKRVVFDSITFGTEEHPFIYIRGNNPSGLCFSNNSTSGDSGTYANFSGVQITFGNSTNKVSIGGNIMSLIFGDNFVNQKSLVGKKFGFHGLFSAATAIEEAHKLCLPATTLTSFCYNRMFGGCQNLKTYPELPSLNLADYCYQLMFLSCTTLTQGPDLPADVLQDYCYANMYRGCSKLEVAPVLNASIMKQYCYQAMFYGCTSLKVGPALNSVNLSNSCYNGIFYGCSALTSIGSDLPAPSTSAFSYYNMFYQCVNLTTAPVIYATSLNGDQACRWMFYGCSKINYIKAMFSGTIDGGTSTNEWVSGVASSGTFVKNTNSSWPLGISGIPNNWTVTTASS